jgi:hypothetical protein
MDIKCLVLLYQIPYFLFNRRETFMIFFLLCYSIKSSQLNVASDNASSSIGISNPTETLGQLRPPTFLPNKLQQPPGIFHNPSLETLITLQCLFFLYKLVGTELQRWRLLPCAVAFLRHLTQMQILVEELNWS